MIQNSTNSYDLAVVGLGYVGLPLAIEASRAGMRVLGIEIDAAKLEALSAGHSYIDDISDADVQEAQQAGFVASPDVAAIASADAISICVPTPLHENAPDLRPVVAATESIGSHLVRGQVVILESTTYPGTTEDLIAPLLEARSGLTAGEDFHLAFSPERIDPGNKEYTLKNTPKVVGGITAESTERAAEVYGKFCDEVVTVSSPREAEMAKLLENTYRHVNIALVNEMVGFCHELGIDVWEAIRAAATKPFGFQAFHPGPGVGGHCIPVDPSYLSHRVRQLGYPFRFVELSDEINSRMPGYVVDRIALLLNDFGRAVNGTKILLVGVAYKPNVSDTRETPARAVARELLARGAEVAFLDPLVEDFEVDGKSLTRWEDAVQAAATHDLVVVLTPHDVLDLASISRAATLVFDTRDSVAGKRVYRL